MGAVNNTQESAAAEAGVGAGISGAENIGTAVQLLCYIFVVLQRATAILNAQCLLSWREQPKNKRLQLSMQKTKGTAISSTAPRGGDQSVQTLH